MLYATGGTSRAVVALDAGTGAQKWVHREDEGERGAAAPRPLSGRGLAYWTDGRDERILYVTPGYRLVALDAKTGSPIPTFGTSGVVDLKTDIDQDDSARSHHGRDRISGRAGRRRETSSSSAPRSAKAPRRRVSRTIKATFAASTFAPASGSGPFTPIPKKGEPGYETWLNGSAEYTGNTGVWSQVTIDEELGLVYLPVESPTGDYYGGHRPGNNLYGESLVCLDLRTGAKKWHYQIVHHPIWDFDIRAAPILADITVDGRAIKAVAVPTKQGILYVFDRVTGKPVWPIVEKPVEKGEVPGEWYSPTQPMPTKPAAYAKNGTSLDDLIDFTPELHAAGRGDRVALQARPDLHAAGGEQGRRPARHARARPDEWRIELAGRRVRSGDAHGLRRVVERGAVVLGLVQPTQGTLGHGLGRAAAPQPGGRGRSVGAGPVDLQAAVRHDQRDQSRQGRDRVAGAARRDARRRAQSRSAQGHEHPAHGTARIHRRHAGDEDARHRRRRAGHDAAGRVRAARCCAPTTRRPAPKSARCSCRRRSADRR